VTPEARRDFVREHRTAIFGYNRDDDGPAMSVVHYAVHEDGTIVVSTTSGRGKARAVSRAPRVSLCVLDEQWPPSYLNVYCNAEVDNDIDTATDTMMRVGGALAGADLDASIRPLLAAKAREEARVTLRLRPYATFTTAPGQHDEPGPPALPW